MTSYVENETDVEFPFDAQEVLEKIMETVTEMEHCPYETTVSLLLTDNAGIRIYNRQYREIDRETDVLSFPNIAFEKAGDFSAAEADEADCLIPTAGNFCWATSSSRWSGRRRRRRNTGIRFCGNLLF